MRQFNSFQIVALFAGMPFLVGWLSEASFPWAVAAFWGASVGYLVLFGFLWHLVYEGVGKE